MMWRSTALRNLLQKSDNWVQPEPTELYQQVTIKMWGQGVVLRQQVSGSNIKAKRQLSVKSQQFILSRIDARHGAFGLIPESLDGALVSNDFPAFDINTSQILPDSLNWMSKTAGFIELCRFASEGTTNRVRLKEDIFLDTEVSLPDLDEQRRIVARIEELAAKVEEARELRSKSNQSAKNILESGLRAAFDRGITDEKWAYQPLKEVAQIARGKFSHRPRNAPEFYDGDIPFIQIGDISNSNLYIENFSQTLNQRGLEISRLFPKGTIVIAITGATIGVTGILDFESCFPDSIVGIVPNREYSYSEYVYWALEYVKQIALDEARSTTQPNINLKHLDSLSIPLPGLDVQHKVVAYLSDLQTKINTLRTLQTQTATELNALLPAILDKAFKGEL